MLLRLDKRTVGEQRLIVLNADGGRGLDGLQLVTADDGRQLPKHEVLADDRVLLILGQPIELDGRAARVDLEYVLHGVLLCAGSRLYDERTP